MKPEDLKVLAERASTVEGRPGDRLDEVRGRIEVARRRRQLAAVSSAVVAVVLALTTGVGLLAVTDPDRTPPVKPAPRPSATPNVPKDDSPSVRRLTYATGHKIHWGDQVIDVGSEVWDVDATDDGVVYVRDQSTKPEGCYMPKRNDRCNTLWFADESRTVPIGTVYGSVIRGYRIALSNVGSTLVWLEPSPEDHPNGAGYTETGEYVVYDTGKRDEVGRFGSGRSGLLGVHGDYVYWLPDQRACVDFYGVCLRFRGSAMRLEVSTGRQVSISWATYKAQRSSWARTFVSPQIEEIGDQTVVRPDHAQPKFSEGFTFRRDGTRLVGEDGTVEVTVRVARTGKPVDLRVPRGYTEADFFEIIQWLDDDRVVLSAEDAGELFVCRLSSGRCKVEVKGSVLTGFRGRG